MKIIIVLLIPFFIYAYENTTSSKESISIIEGASNGIKVIEEKSLEPIEINKNNSKKYYSEVILNWNRYFESKNLRGNEFIGKTSENLLVSNVKENLINNDVNLTKNEELAIVKGFCFIQNEVNVGKQPSALRLNCQTNIGAIVLFGNLVNLNEKSSLILDPKYIEKDNVRFDVKSSIVTNEKKTSYNIATFVNDRKIAKVGYGALSAGSVEVKNSSNEYLRALEESKKKQEISYVNISDGQGNVYPQAIQNTNTEKPDPLNYLIKGAINVTADAVKVFADISKEDLPYLYQIVAKTKIWVDLKVNKKGEYVK
ncbi:hypothetical protein FPD46_07900 [Campylobacter peloridis]|uniref:Uncharacterized protein n=1 Tax=Campylobacter peloridis TaxID=488546 RepID=A0A5C7DKA2_9BACT|nr:hypothetical protein [Campylobacter peloridis]TXE78479.1 hypothetical protein FPD46_07900 [Campylobacter peloridis]